VIKALAIGILASLCVALSGAAQEEARPAPPQRVVSMNLCTDQLVLLLARREQIASLSIFAADEDMSPLAARARGIPANEGAAESVFAFEPDLVITGRYTAGFAANLLERAEIPVLRVEPANSFAGITRNIAQVAEALGRGERGRALIRDFEAELKALRETRVTGGPSALVFHARGATAGAGGLYDQILTLAGLRNLAAEAGLTGYAYLGVEDVLRLNPEVLVASRADPSAPSLSTEIARHRALRGGRERLLIDSPGKYWSCGTPQVLEAVRRLRVAAGLGPLRVAQDGGAQGDRE